MRSLLSVGAFVVAMLFTSNLFARGSGILFVGNSITYVGNLPAVYDALTGQPVKSDMFVRGGAFLTEFARDPRLEKALATGRYRLVVLQEQGGNVLCLASKNQRDSDACKATVAAHIKLARMAKTYGAKVVYLGTYQTDPHTSHLLVQSESELAKRMDVAYAEVSESLLALSQVKPNLAWYNPGDLHPGPTLTTLMAVRVAQATASAPLEAKDLCTVAPIYKPSGNDFDGLVVGSDVPQRSKQYCVARRADVRWILDMVQASAREASK